MLALMGGHSWLYQLLWMCEAADEGRLAGRRIGAAYLLKFTVTQAMSLVSGKIVAVIKAKKFMSNAGHFTITNSRTMQLVWGTTEFVCHEHSRVGHLISCQQIQTLSRMLPVPHTLNYTHSKEH